jgi:hypothetical protein
MITTLHQDRRQSENWMHFSTLTMRYPTTTTTITTTKNPPANNMDAVRCPVHGMTRCDTQGGGMFYNPKVTRPRCYSVRFSLACEYKRWVKQRNNPPSVAAYAYVHISLQSAYIYIIIHTSLPFFLPSSPPYSYSSLLHLVRPFPGSVTLREIDSPLQHRSSLVT